MTSIVAHLPISNLPLTRFFFFLHRDADSLHHGSGSLGLRADQHSAGVQGAAVAATEEGRQGRQQLPQTLHNQNGRYGEDGM